MGISIRVFLYAVFVLLEAGQSSEILDATELVQTRVSFSSALGANDGRSTVSSDMRCALCKSCGGNYTLRLGSSDGPCQDGASCYSHACAADTSAATEAASLSDSTSPFSVCCKAGGDGVSKAASLASLAEKLPASTRKQPCAGKCSLFIGIFSATDNWVRRARQREICLPIYRNAGFDSVKFFVGRASDNSVGDENHNQGQMATQREFEVSKRLLEEGNQFNDIVFVPTRDTYRDTTDKLIYLFQHGVRQNKAFIAKVDDDTCLDVEIVEELFTNFTQSQSQSGQTELYGGSYLFNGSEYDTMRGLDGTVAPFMAGPIEILSSGLARKVFEDSANYVAQYNVYGTSSEDSNLGKFIKHVESVKNGLSVQFLESQDVYTDLPGKDAKNDGDLVSRRGGGNRAGTSSEAEQVPCLEKRWCPPEQDRCDIERHIRRSCPCTCATQALMAEAQGDVFQRRTGQTPFQLAALTQSQA